MSSLSAAQAWVFLVFGLLMFGVQVFVLVDALRRPQAAYLAAGKMTKQRWLIILGAALALGFLALPGGFISPLNFLNLVAFVASAVYLVDVRPAVRQSRGGGSGRNNGPYGPW